MAFKRFFRYLTYATLLLCIIAVAASTFVIVRAYRSAETYPKLSLLYQEAHNRLLVAKKRRAEEPERYAVALYKKGRFFSEQNLDGFAARYYENVLLEQPKVKHDLLVSSLRDLSTHYWSVGRYKKAEKYLKHLAMLVQSTDKQIFLGGVQIHLAALYSLTGKKKQSKSAFQNAVQAFSTEPSPDLLREISRVFQSQLRPKSAEMAARVALELKPGGKPQNPVSLADTYMRLGEIQWFLLQKGRALVHFTKAYDSLASAPDTAKTRDALQRLGYYYYVQLGKGKVAIELFKRAEAINNNLDNTKPSDIGLALVGLQIIYKRTHQANKLISLEERYPMLTEKQPATKKLKAHSVLLHTSRSYISTTIKMLGLTVRNRLFMRAVPLYIESVHLSDDFIYYRLKADVKSRGIAKALCKYVKRFEQIPCDFYEK